MPIPKARLRLRCERIWFPVERAFWPTFGAEEENSEKLFLFRPPGEIRPTVDSVGMSNRAQYSDETKATVRAKYPLCKTPDDRDKLARECGIGSRQKLYNLASRLVATRPHTNSHVEWSGEDAAYDATRDDSRLYLRDDPDKLSWSADDDRYLREHFGRTFVEAIGFMLNRTETAVSYRARELGLRNIPRYYDAKKVAAWLGISMRDLLLLSRRGLDIFPCTDRYGKLKITLVSTTSLARVLLRDRLWKRLVDKFDADQFFVKDIIESIVALQREEAVWEPNSWVSHGHVSLNPFSEACFGWFYDGHDRKMAGADLDPRDLSPSANVTSDYWRRGANGQPAFERELAELADEPELAPRLNGKRAKRRPAKRRRKSPAAA
jgi:hypothetical protein